jgi:glycosyltransferase involved in cell wall biosynthesis
LDVRTRIQRREIRKADFVIGASNRFVELLRSDYGLEPKHTAVLRHPIDLERFSPGPLERPWRPFVLLYVSRVSSRKGLELITALSHSLADLAGVMKIEIYGGSTMWSDYTGMLDELNPAVASYGGQLPAAELVKRYHSAHALLLPSRYEPFGLVVGEALATGMPVVVSSEVGAGEAVHPSVCRRFADADLAGFEHEVRQLLSDLDAHDFSLRSTAVEEANRLFAPRVIGEEFQQLLERYVAQLRNSSPRSPVSTSRLRVPW